MVFSSQQQIEVQHASEEAMRYSGEYFHHIAHYGRDLQNLELVWEDP
jgi:hypothetical protein